MEMGGEGAGLIAHEITRKVPLYGIPTTRCGLTRWFLQEGTERTEDFRRRQGFGGQGRIGVGFVTEGASAFVPQRGTSARQGREAYLGEENENENE